MKLAKRSLSQEQITQRLKAAGVNPTAQRLAIARYLLCESDHPTADEVKHWADQNFPKMSLATVYNTLRSLVNAGIIRELKFAHSEKTIFDHNTTAHYHFLDEKTGQLLDLDPEELKVEIRKSLKGSKITGIDVVVRGVRAVSSRSAG